VREFLDLVLPEKPPHHSTISRTRRLIDVEARGNLHVAAAAAGGGGLVKGII